MKMNIMQENQIMVNVNVIVNITYQMFKGFTFKQNSVRLNLVFYKLVKQVKNV